MDDSSQDDSTQQKQDTGITSDYNQAQQTYEETLVPIAGEQAGQVVEPVGAQVETVNTEQPLPVIEEAPSVVAPENTEAVADNIETSEAVQPLQNNLPVPETTAATSPVVGAESQTVVTPTTPVAGTIDPIAPPAPVGEAPAAGGVDYAGAGAGGDYDDPGIGQMPGSGDESAPGEPGIGELEV